MRFLPACILLAAGCFYIETALIPAAILILLGGAFTLVAFRAPTVPLIYSSVVEGAGGGLFELLQPQPPGDEEDSGKDFDYE